MGEAGAAAELGAALLRGAGFANARAADSVALDLLRAGFARVHRRAAARRLDRDVLDAMVDAQESARRARVGQWEYGDVDSDDDAS